MLSRILITCVLKFLREIVENLCCVCFLCCLRQAASGMCVHFTLFMIFEIAHVVAIQKYMAGECSGVFVDNCLGCSEMLIKILS